MEKIKLIFSYIHHKLFAKSHKGYGVHSPFIYNFCLQVFNKNAKFYSFSKINSVRYYLLDTKNEINITDLGAGSKKTNSQKRKISEIAGTSAISKKNGEMLFRLVNYFQPKTCVELGTSLGLGTLYIAMANSKATVYTIEGSESIANTAKKSFEHCGATNIIQQIGNFDDLLPKLLQSLQTVDFVYFDGNHQKSATLNYFYQCLEKADEKTVFVFDDIRWSAGMYEAWNEIKNHIRVKATVDLFFMGIVFFSNDFLEKQHYAIDF